MPEPNASSSSTSTSGLLLIKFMSFFRINPYDTNDCSSLIINFVTILSIIVSFSAAVFDLILNNPQSNILMDEIYFMCLLKMTLSKLAWVMIKKKTLRGLFDEINHMWGIDKFGPGVFVKYNKIDKRIYTFFKLLMYIMNCYYIVILFGRYAYDDQILPGYYARISFNKVFILQMFPSFVMINTQIIFISIFIYFVSIMYIQAGLIKDSLQDANIGNLNERLKDVVAEHNRLTGYVNKLGDAYFDILFVLFLLILSSLVMILYLVTNETMYIKGPLIALYFFYYAILSLEAGVYCCGGMIIDEQLISIANAAYNVEWYKYNPKTSKALILVMLRAQNTSTLQAADLIKVDLKTFTSIILNSFKICTAIRTVEGISNDK